MAQCVCGISNGLAVLAILRLESSYRLDLNAAVDKNA